MRNLKAEMARNNVKVSDLMKVTHLSDRSIRNRLKGTAKFTIDEAIEVKRTFFPSLSMDYLFAPDSDTDGVGA